jgi:hypothetical protein
MPSVELQQVLTILQPDRHGNKFIRVKGKKETGQTDKIRKIL